MPCFDITENSLDPTIAWYGGRIFKDMGEAFLVEFPSAVESVQCAVELQSGMTERNGDLPLDRHIMLRLGINLADVVVDGEDLHGDDVNTSARLSALAVPGTIICSEGIRHQVGSKLDITFIDYGAKEVKNILYAIHVYGIEPVTLKPTERTSDAGADDNIRPPGNSLWPFCLSPTLAAILRKPTSRTAWRRTFLRNCRKHQDSSSSVAMPCSSTGINPLTWRRSPVNLASPTSSTEASGRSGNRVRVAAELIEGTSGRSLWGERYDREAIRCICPSG